MDDVVNARVFLILMGARLVGDYLYAWGGESCSEGGYDCSGFVSTILMQTARSWPDLYRGGRQTARGLYDYFDRRGCPDINAIPDLKPGCLLFYRYPGKKLHHVALHVVNAPPLQAGSTSMEIGPVAFEAGGSGSAATSPRAALTASAGVRLTASDFHGRGVEWVGKDPFLLLSAPSSSQPEEAEPGSESSGPPATEDLIQRLEVFRDRINLTGAQRYNQTQSTSAWDVVSLPAPLADYPPGSETFALCVALKQSERNLVVDGYLGEKTLAALKDT